MHAFANFRGDDSIVMEEILEQAAADGLFEKLSKEFSVKTSAQRYGTRQRRAIVKQRKVARPR